MKACTLTVHWHDECQPIYSVDFQPQKDENGKSKRVATGGGDNNVRIWKLKYDADKKEPTVEYLSTLHKHTQAVNVVRFSPKGDILATAGDDGMLILWTLSDTIVKEFGAEEDEDIQESWVVKDIFRSSTSEIYDLAWSPNSDYIATGLMDNITRIYHVGSGREVNQIAEHTHYVQGVSWDPLNEFLATQSADRSVHISYLKYTHNKNLISLIPTIFFKINKADFDSGYGSNQTAVIENMHLDDSLKLSNMGPPSSKQSSILPSAVQSVDQNLSNVTTVMPSSPKSPGSAKSIAVKRTTPIYVSETLQSFFRRLKFSPDGSLLLTPLGIFKHEINLTSSTTNESSNLETITNTVYIYTRAGFNKQPLCHIPGLKKPAIAIAFSPVFYKLADLNKTPVFALPYRMIFAVATQDSIIIYDTQSLTPLAYSSNHHYCTITDLCWNIDGESLLACSADGFCSHVLFESGSLGEQLSKSEYEEIRRKHGSDYKTNEAAQQKSMATSQISCNNGKTSDSNRDPPPHLTQNSKPEPTCSTVDAMLSESQGTDRKKKRKIAPTLITK